jgi:hypothetical protein
MSRKVHGWLRDEQGDKSISRLLLIVTMAFTFTVIAVDALTEAAVPGEAYALLGSLVVGLIAWAGGARIARYIGPQVAGIAQGIAAKVSPGSTTVTVTPSAPAEAAPDGGSEAEPRVWTDGKDEGVL